MFTANKKKDNASQRDEGDTEMKLKLASSTSIVESLIAHGFPVKSDKWMKELDPPVVIDALYFLSTAVAGLEKPIDLAGVNLSEETEEGVLTMLKRNIIMKAINQLGVFEFTVLDLIIPKKKSTRIFFTVLLKYVEFKEHVDKIVENENREYSEIVQEMAKIKAIETQEINSNEDVKDRADLIRDDAKELRLDNQEQTTQLLTLQNDKIILENSKLETEKNLVDQTATKTELLHFIDQLNDLIEDRTALIVTDPESIKKNLEESERALISEKEKLLEVSKKNEEYSKTVEIRSQLFATIEETPALVARLNSLRDEVTDMHFEAENIKNENLEKEDSTLLEIRKDIVSLEEQIARVNSDIEDENNRNNKLQSELRRKRMSLEQFQSKSEETAHNLMEEINDLQRDLMNSKEQIEHLKVEENAVLQEYKIFLDQHLILKQQYCKDSL